MVGQDSVIEGTCEVILVLKIFSKQKQQQIRYLSKFSQLCNSRYSRSSTSMRDLLKIILIVKRVKFPGSITVRHTF